jgi:hypothetical protein
MVMSIAMKITTISAVKARNASAPFVIAPSTVAS